MTKRWLGWLTGVAVLCAAGSAVAQDAGSNKKIKLGLRLGYGLPMGKETGDATIGDATIAGVKLGDDLSGQVPIWIDAGYLVTPHILVGLYGQYGFASAKDCPNGVSCSAHDIRFGVQGQYHFLPGGADPWLGLGIGRESLTGSTSGAINHDISMSGWELLNLQGGVDFAALGDTLSVGPFVSFSLDQFTDTSLDGQSQSIPTTALHEWLTLGVKGTFGL